MRARTDEAIEVLRELWRSESNEHRGRFFDAPALRSEPRPTAPIPILVGGLSPAAVRRAVTLGDGYVGVSVSMTEAAELVVKLRSAVEAAGRDPSAFEIALMCPEASTAGDLCELSDAGVDILYVMPFPDPAKTPTSVSVKRDVLRRHGEIVADFKARVGTPGAIHRDL